MAHWCKTCKSKPLIIRIDAEEQSSAYFFPGQIINRPEGFTASTSTRESRGGIMVVIRKLTKSSICALIACLAGFLLCASVLRNWSVHARFNLLLNGHLFSELVDPKGLDAELVHNRQHLL